MARSKRRLRTSRCPCRGRLGTLKNPCCPWRGCPAAGQNLETGHLSRHYIAEISLNVTLNHNQQQQLKKSLLKKGTPRDLFFAPPGSSPGRIRPETPKCMWQGLEHFIPTNFFKHPLSGSVVKADY